MDITKLALICLAIIFSLILVGALISELNKPVMKTAECTQMCKPDRVKKVNIDIGLCECDIKSK